ncbi:GNAT family N-acetyltransferase [Sphingobium sp. SCG-1]|uniref:GNAT family N-acetyltransferase n=1 Tax=Sphingobium sp. SCG-1 TaxID=2072936 RepID=UPI000CD67FF6|nr:GNAT family N-acetyltransferase [Sphingobium sp. SCG-1]AUW58050.1 GNAT family N-acetyltransferase [Sphingobium sp. SCG-1]
MSLSAPAPLADHHNLDSFDSGVASLDDWLRRRARANQAAGASRTFVICEGDDVAGYYALSSGSITTNEASGRMRRNMPEPIPVVLLGRLAIGQTYQGRGIGRALVRDAAKRVIAAGEEIGIRGIVVHAINEEARAFYLALGFAQSPTAEMTLMVSMADLKASL